MFKRKHYLALGAVTLVTALVLSLPSRAVSHLKLGIGGLFLPLFGTVHAVRQLPDRAADVLLPRSELLKEIETLQRENQQLKVQNLQAAATARENDQLRALVGWQRRQPWRLKLASVVLRDPANWWRTIQIDLGKRDGMVENLPVLTSDGLVGRVSSVGYTRSQVILVGDPGCRVSARVVNPAHDMGVISPGGPLDNSLVNLAYLSGNANLKPGQDVVTSGEGGIFPPGIPIGQVADSGQAEFGLYTEARVKLSANLGALDQVWVLFP
ncbi:MAG: rod shape-determining protein MreC [Verrucomicrobiota bacterium]|jgi:rod shape-determining protein MreC